MQPGSDQRERTARSAKRDPTFERWRFAERIALRCPQAKARRLPPFGGALRAIKFSRLASPCLQPGKRSTGATIWQPRGKRGSASERWRFAGRVGLRCPQAKARRLPPCGGALRAINFSRLPSLRLVCNPVSDQRERRFDNRAGARNGIQRPNAGPQAKARRLPPCGGALRAIKFSRLASLRLVCNPVSDQRERRFENRAGARNGIQRPDVGANRDETSGRRRPLPFRQFSL